MSAPYRVTKTYGHELGLSATFRQWRANSHCRFIHGYALGFKLVFESDKLDENGWVFDFGSLKPIKQRLVETFDHRMLVAADDPERGIFEELGHERCGLAQVTVVERVGCEAFARMVWGWVDEMLAELLRTDQLKPWRGVRLVEVECREHAGNAASYMGEGR